MLHATGSHPSKTPASSAQLVQHACACNAAPACMSDQPVACSCGSLHLCSTSFNQLQGARRGPGRPRLRVWEAALRDQLPPNRSSTTRLSGATTKEGRTNTAPFRELPSSLAFPPVALRLAGLPPASSASVCSSSSTAILYTTTERRSGLTNSPSSLQEGRARMQRLRQQESSKVEPGGCSLGHLSGAPGPGVASRPQPSQPRCAGAHPCRLSRPSTTP